MEDGNKATYKYVFVCGLNRSGTTLLERNIGKLENCTSFKNRLKFDDTIEGWKLQDVYPPEFEFGGPGRYGFDSRAHLTESSGVLTPENVARLRKAWHLFWDKSKTICVEKTPANLLMTRFLQAAFPHSYFIVVKRHPVPVSMATQRMWKVKVTSLHRLFEHWLRCYELFEEDKQHLRHVYELTYEDYVRDPARYHREIAQFIGTRIPEEALEQPSAAHSKKYFDRWHELLTNSACRRYYRDIAEKYEPRFAKFGYSLTKGLFPAEEVRRWEGKPSAAVGILYYLWADTCAFLLRFAKAKLDPKLLIKAVLPDFILAKIWRIRHRQILNEAKRFQLAGE
jgi:hypothetical protein